MVRPSFGSPLAGSEPGGLFAVARHRRGEQMRVLAKKSKKIACGTRRTCAVFMICVIRKNVRYPIDQALVWKRRVALWSCAAL
jgi:hypothetical protein